MKSPVRWVLTTQLASCRYFYRPRPLRSSSRSKPHTASCSLHSLH